MEGGIMTGGKVIVSIDVFCSFAPFSRLTLSLLLILWIELN